MNFFKRIPLSYKFILIVTIPLLLTLFLFLKLHSERQIRVNGIVNYINKIQNNGNLILLIQNLLDERKLSYDHVMAVDDKSLSAQRSRTDSILHLLQNSADAQLSGMEKFTDLGKLDSIRYMIDKDSITSNNVTDYYSTLVFRLNTLISIWKPSYHKIIPFYNQLYAQKLLSEIYTYQRIIQANIYTILFTNEYEIEILFGSYGAYKIMGSFEDEYELKVAEPAKTQYNQLLNHPAYSEMRNLLQASFSTFNVNDSITANEWWSLSDKGLSALSALQQNLWSEAVSQMEKIKQKEVSSLYFLTISIVIILILVGVFVTLTIIGLLRMLREIKEAAYAISLGNTETQIKKWSDDEIGSLVESMRLIQNNEKQLAFAANEIGKGNFNFSVTKRSEADILGKAIITMQESLKTFNQEMELLVKQRTDALERSNKDLQQFAHVASHDLKEPLRKISFIISKLKEENLDNNVGLHIDKMANAVTRLLSMIDGILNYSIIETDDEGEVSVDLNKVIAGIINDLELPITEKNIQITIDPLPKILGKPALIHQLFLNLISNSIKFASSERQPNINVTANPANTAPYAFINGNAENYTEIIVKDNGIGFEQQYADSLFNIFTRLNRKDLYEGSGLGLSLCKKIAERHGGYIIAEGQPGAGAQFRVGLPLAKRQEMDMQKDEELMNI